MYLDTVDSKGKIYQGDSLLPQLFCMALALFSNFIWESIGGYKFKDSTATNHYFWMISTLI